MDMVMMKSNPLTRSSGGGMKLPIGFRFRPTDEELIVHYLKRKIQSFPLPASIIPELDVFQTNPWDLPGNPKEKRYFFSQRKGNLQSKYGDVNGGLGYWKASCVAKHIAAPPGVSSSNELTVVGLKRTLSFYEGKGCHGLKTRWVMQEYSLVGSWKPPHLTQNTMVQVGDWVVCRVYQKKRKARNHGINYSLNLQQPAGGNKSIWNSTTVGTLSPNSCDDSLSPSGPPSPSCSSGITEISDHHPASPSHDSYEEEASSRKRYFFIGASRPC